MSKCLNKSESKTNLCLNCNNEFKAKRSTAKFCSHKCQVAFHRDTKGTVSVTNETVSVPGNVTVKYLEDTPLKELRAEGVWIPNWKTAGYKRKDIDKSFMAIIEMFPTCKWIFKGYIIKQQ